MTRIKLDNLESDPQHKALLLRMLRKTGDNRSAWGEGKWYKVKYHNAKVKVSLDHTVIKRLSKKGGYRYEVIDNTPLGKGGFGTAYPVTMTFKIEETKLITKLKPPGKRRVVKVIAHKNSKGVIDDVIAEYTMSNMTPHLSPKFPVMYKDLLFITFRRIEGTDLFNIINDDISKRRTLTLEQRFQLTIGLMEALQTQVFDPGLIHRDFKPENIIVDLHANSIGAIDYGLAKIGEERTDKETVGSAVYAAPEVFFDLGTNRLSDVYSLGRILGLIWRNNTTTYRANLSRETIIDNAHHNDYSQLFTDIKGLEPLAKKIIYETLQQMTQYSSKNRCELSVAYARMCVAKEIQFPAVFKKQAMISGQEIKVELAKLKSQKMESKKASEFKEAPPDQENKQVKKTKNIKKWSGFFSIKGKDQKAGGVVAPSSKKKEKEVFHKAPDEGKSMDIP